MDVSRGIGIGIVMVIPSFVGGGVVWDIFNNWGAVFGWIGIIAVIYGVILYKGSCLNN
jgi:hypothetical protein